MVATIGLARLFYHKVSREQKLIRWFNLKGNLWFVAFLMNGPGSSLLREGNVTQGVGAKNRQLGLARRVSQHFAASS
jgi:hypothetical protein